ncbi:hypothetical protein JW921_00630 [Candidatus Fermentibacterales bacterium]|nr:hypothetical protein [Candidatus Fermentibacterales bacterium]
MTRAGFLLLLVALSMSAGSDDLFPLEPVELYYNWIGTARPLQGMRWIAPGEEPLPVPPPADWGQLYMFGDNIIEWWPGEAYLRDDANAISVVCFVESSSSWMETGFVLPDTLAPGQTWDNRGIAASVEAAGRVTVYYGTFSGCLSVTYAVGDGHWELVLAPGVGIVREKAVGMRPLAGDPGSPGCPDYEVELAQLYRVE